MGERDGWTLPTTSIAVDAHVHLHDCFPLGGFLDAAHAHLAAAVLPGRPFTGVLLLTDSARDDAFGRLARAAGSGAAPPDAGGWRIGATGESISLRAFAADGRELIVLAGRQVAAAEDLEVLLLATSARPPDGLPIRRVLEIAREHDVLHVIPWGAGKWWLHRGALLSELLRTAPPETFFLGDESARPGFWPAPRHFDEARARGIRVLRGTDPLPFPRESRRVGSYGFVLAAPPLGPAPAVGMRRILADVSLQPVDFGEPERAFAFVRNQVAMQIRKRKRGRVVVRDGE